MHLILHICALCFRLCHSSRKSMEQIGQESNAQKTWEVCSNGAEKSSVSSIVFSLEKGIFQKHQPEGNFSSPTPVKTKEPSRIKCEEGAPELPEKWDTQDMHCLKLKLMFTMKNLKLI